MTDKYSVRDALRSLGVENGDILLFHSSLKSFGYIEGGADAVIDGALLAVGSEGTLVAPTLVQRDFQNAYQRWNRETTPSDVGKITEVFRLRKDARRSDQATHSVAAIGRLADTLTEGHTAFGPRHSIYGNYAFAESSPWQKMYDLGGKVVFIGATIESNTYRHFIEARTIERVLGAVGDEEKKRALLSRLAGFDDRPEYFREAAEQEKSRTPMRLAFPYLRGDDAFREVLAAAGLERDTLCGESHFMLFPIRDMVDEIERRVLKDPSAWFLSSDGIAWITDAIEAGKHSPSASDAVPAR